MEIKCKKYGDVLNVACIGNMDVKTADLLKEQLTERLKQDKYFVVDMAQVTDVDSAGVAVLIYLLRQARRKGGTMKLARLTENVCRFMVKAAVYRYFNVFETLEAALDSYLE